MNRPSSFAFHIQPLFTSEQRTCMIKNFAWRNTKM